MSVLLELVGALLATRILYGAYKEYCHKQNISSLELVTPLIKIVLAFLGIGAIGFIVLVIYALTKR